MRNNKNKANWVLVGTTAGYLLAVPFQDSFTGGLLASGFGAAMVGGAADWFAVTALFRRPLGISFKTEVIPRNRQRIAGDIVDIVQNRLLSKENIRSKLNGYDMTGMLLTFLAEGGREDLLAAVQAMLRDFILRIKPQELGGFLTELAQENAGSLSLAALFSKITVWSNQQGYTEKIFDFMVVEAQKLAGSEHMYRLLYEFIEASRQAYAGERTERKLANWLFSQGGFTPERLAGIAQDKLQFFLRELSKNDNTLRLEFLNYLKALPAKLAEDCVWQAKIESWKLEVLANKELATVAARFVRQKASQAAEGILTQALTQQLELACQYITKDQLVYKRIDTYLTSALVTLVEKYHHKIGTLVANRLDRYTAQELAELIENKVSEDLQMIRLNGSTVGGLAGMLIFLITYWWQ